MNNAHISRETSWLACRSVLLALSFFCYLSSSVFIFILFTSRSSFLCPIFFLISVYSTSPFSSFFRFHFLSFFLFFARTFHLSIPSHIILFFSLSLFLYIPPEYRPFFLLFQIFPVTFFSVRIHFSCQNEQVFF